jgi:hypothetical protein
LGAENRGGFFSRKVRKAIFSIKEVAMKIRRLVVSAVLLGISLVVPALSRPATAGIIFCTDVKCPDGSTTFACGHSTPELVEGAIEACGQT